MKPSKRRDWRKRNAKLPDQAKRALATGGIIAALAGGAQAPAPADMPKYLADQYKDHGKTQLEDRRRTVKRLTAIVPRPVPTLTDRDAKRLRGK